MTMTIMTLLRLTIGEDGRMEVAVLSRACAGVCEQLRSPPTGGEHFQRPQDFKSPNITCTGSASDVMML